MESFIPQLIILILGGVGFLTYRHPAIARRVLTVISIASISILFVIQSFYYGKVNGFSRSLDQFPGSEMQSDTFKGIKAAKESFEQTDTYLNYWFVGIFLFYFVFLLLSFQFDKIHDKSNSEAQNSTPPDTL